MNWPTHPAYKNSGVQWLGEVPAHWGLSPMFTVGHERTLTNAGLSETNLLSLSYGRIVPKDIDTTDGLLPASFDTYQIVEPCDIVFRFTDLQNDKRSLRSALVPERGIITSAYMAFSPTQIDPKYFSYLMRSYDLTKVFYSRGGGLRQSLKYEDVKRLPILVPPTDEQRVISRFLDRETAKIDALIDKQEQLIATLREDRAATITQAVTKGLDPDVVLKDSGVEGVGLIPGGWSMQRLKMLLVEPLAYGANAAADDDTPGNPRYVRITDIAADGSLRAETFRSLPPEVAAPYLLTEGDLLFARSGATVGKTFMYRESWGTCCYAGYLIRARLDQAKVVPAYMNYFTATTPYWYHVVSEQIQATIQNVSAERYNELVVTVPPLSVQREIIDHLDDRCGKIDSLIAKSIEMTETLREYRSALITNAVTGKIDVREAV